MKELSENPSYPKKVVTKIKGKNIYETWTAGIEINRWKGIRWDHCSDKCWMIDGHPGQFNTLEGAIAFAISIKEWNAYCMRRD